MLVVVAVNMCRWYWLTEVDGGGNLAMTAVLFVIVIMLLYICFTEQNFQNTS
jgi:hypothetical protein